MSRSQLRVNYEYSSKFKRDAVRDLHPIGLKLALGQRAVLTAQQGYFRSSPVNRHHQTGPVGPVVPTHKVAALQPAAREQEPRGR